MAGDFQLLPVFDLAATGLFALSGALRAVRKGYDVAGLVTLALVAGIGGGLLRDGIFLQDGPPAALVDHRFLFAIGIACAVGWFAGAALERRFHAIFLVVDALGLGAFAVVGAQKALSADLTVPAAIVVGSINAVGGGILRDLLSGEEPDVFKPGGYYALAAFAGALVFCAMARGLGTPSTVAAAVGIVLTFLLRVLSVRYGWRTRRAPGRPPWTDDPGGSGGADGEG